MDAPGMTSNLVVLMEFSNDSEDLDILLNIAEMLWLCDLSDTPEGRNATKRQAHSTGSQAPPECCITTNLSWEGMGINGQKQAGIG